MNNKVNIQLIIEGCLNGQEQFERKLFENYYPYVKSICLRYSGLAEEAEEMLNDCFYKLFKYLNRYDKQYDFLPWLRKVCINSCLEYNRKYEKSSKLKFQELAFDGSQDEPYTFEIIDSELNLMKYLNALPPAYRNIFNLYVMDEYKHHEIADMLGISVGTSKSNLSRAKAILRQKLKDKFPAISKSKSS